MQYKTFLLKLEPGYATKIHKWCTEQFGEELISWKYVYGGGCTYSDGMMDQTFIIKDIDNIVLFELTWGELKSNKQYLY